MSLFKRNPVDALAKQRILLAGDEAKIADLQRERAAALLATEGTDEIVAIDIKVTEARRRISICRDRIEALTRQVAQERADRREAARADAIRLIQKRLAARTAVAAELEASIKRTGDLFFQLIQSESVAPLWPFGPVPGATVDVSAVRREVGYLAFSAGRPTGGRTIYPAPNNSGLGVTGVHAIGVLAAVSNQSTALLSRLRELPLTDDAADDDEAAPAETVPEPHGLAELATT
jgi:hypothetical protein